MCEDIKHIAINFQKNAQIRKGVTPDLTEDNHKASRSVLLCPLISPFLNRLVTGDKKCVFYNNIKQLEVNKPNWKISALTRIVVSFDVTITTDIYW